MCVHEKHELRKLIYFDIYVVNGEEGYTSVTLCYCVANKTFKTIKSDCRM